MRFLPWLLSLALCACIAGCAPLGEIRWNHTAANLFNENQDNEALLSYCSPGKKGAYSTRDLRNHIEEYGTHLIGYVEYSDQGWEYNNGRQRQRLIERLRTDLNDEAKRNAVFINVVFIHGWHHNAADGDCNVNEFRAMIRKVSEDLRTAARERGLPVDFMVNGIYVGWRGESVPLPVLRQTTIFGRRTAAEHIAKGSVRELFADLRALEYGDRAKADYPRDRVRTIVIGHSFGGLIAFHSLSQELLSNFVLHQPGFLPVPSHGNRCATPDMAPSVWPDMTVLINPAFEASRFEAIHNAGMVEESCNHVYTRPILIVVTADNDFATKTAFPFFRSIASLFEQYDPTSEEAAANERESNLHAVGFVRRYQTHRLELVSDHRNPQRKCIRQYANAAAPGQLVNPSPVWVVGVTPDIVNGHDGFLYPDVAKGRYDPYLLNWMMNVYLSGTQSTAFKPMYDWYRNAYCVSKDEK